MHTAFLLFQDNERNETFLADHVLRWPVGTEAGWTWLELLFFLNYYSL